MPDPFMGWLSYVDQLLIPVVHIAFSLAAISVAAFVVFCAMQGTRTLVKKPALGFKVMFALCKLSSKELLHQAKNHDQV